MPEFDAGSFVMGLCGGVGIYFVAIMAGQAGLFAYFGALPSYIQQPPTFPGQWW